MTAGRISTAALLAALIGMSAWTWDTWPDVQVDYGREIYTAWRVSAGDVLHRDLAWFNGPLSVWGNSLLLRVFGVSLKTLELANLLLIVATAFVIRGLFARWYGLLAGTSAALVFTAVFALGHNAGLAGYNFVCPYSHELTHGAMLAFLGFLCMAKRDERSGSRWSCGAALCFGLVSLTKSEVALAMGLAWVAYIAMARETFSKREALLCALAFALPPLLAFLAFASNLGVAGAQQALLAPLRAALDPATRELPFYRRMAGFDQPLANALRAGRGFGFAFLFFAPFFAIDYRRGARLKARRSLALGVSFLASIVMLLALDVDWLRSLFALPLFLVVWLVASPRRRVEPARFAFGVFALALLAKMLLATWALQYGFVLALPGTLLLTATLVGSVPCWLARRAGGGAVSRGVALAAILMFVAGHLRETDRWLGIQTVRVGEGRDSFLSDGRGVLANQALAALEREPADASLLVLPEGALLNFLSRRVNPTRFINFLPPEVLLFGEERMAREMARSPADLCVLWHKDTSEYGVALFGQDYAKVIGREVLSGRTVRFGAGDPPLQLGSRRGIQLLGSKP